MRQKFYTIDQACAILNVTDVPLTEWCRRANIAKQKRRGDQRLRWLTAADVRFLAREHNRIIDEDAPLMRGTRHIPTTKEVAGRLAEMEARLETLIHHGAIATSAPEVDAINASTHTILEHTPAPRPKRVTHTISHEPLPDGWISCRQFAEAHNINFNHFANTRRRMQNHYQVNADQWGEGSALITEALTQEDQRFWMEYFTDGRYARFTPCSACPHDHP